MITSAIFISTIFKYPKYPPNNHLDHMGRVGALLLLLCRSILCLSITAGTITNADGGVALPSDIAPPSPLRHMITDQYLYIIGRFCLFVTFLFIPALLPSPVQSCYDWMKLSIWQKNKLQDTKQIQKKSIDKSKSDFANK